MYYHISKRKIRIGATLTQGIFGERVIAQKHVNEHYKNYVKEKIFEDIRQQKFPKLPSRLNCVFLFPDLAMARSYWATVLHYQAYIYEVNIISGKPFLAEMDLVHCDGIRYSMIQTNAKKYWEQVQHPHSQTLETLLDGKATVNKLVESPSKIW